MKQLLPILVICLISAVSSWGQYLNPAVTTVETEDGKVTRCYTTQKIEEARNLDPSIAQRRAKVERSIEQFMEKERNGTADSRNMPPVYTIPVVVHIVYRTTQQNVSDARVLEQIQVLNDDYRRMNADAGNTPSTFSGIAADCEIQFCLATRDPQGNPTTGITRTSTTANNIGGPGSSAYYSTAQGGMTAWNTNQYLNIWVCAIGSSILGYTYTPGNAPNGADGVVLDYRYFGKTGTSAPYNGGRTATHEVGHWLNLEHIWGPGNGGCSTDDGVSDTPMQDQEYGGCPSHPQTSCSSTDMFMNYMDYVNDACMNAFTAGQKSRMRAAITAARPGLLTSQGCLTATDDAGVPQIDYPTGTICSPTFTPQVTIKNYGGTALTSVTINYKIDLGTIYTQVWTGNLATNQSATVTLPPQTVTVGAHTFYAWTSMPNGTTDGAPNNDNAASQFSISNGGLALPFAQGFEGTTFPPTGWTLNNPDGAVSWARTTTAAKTGVASMFMDNWDYDSIGQVDQVTLPALNMNNSASVTMTFQLAYALYSATGYSDTLRVWASNDCGATWSKVYEKFDAPLTTVSQLVTTEFVPTANQWRMETIDLTSFGMSNDVRIRFEHVADYENNLYVDDVNITNTPLLGFNQLQAKGSLSVYPNPTTGLLNIDVKLPSANDVQIMIYNSLGQLVSQVSDSNVIDSNYKINLDNLAKGVYHIQVAGGGEIMTQKVILQ